MAHRVALLVVGLVSAVRVLAQDLAIPTAWGSITSGDTRATREGYANSAAQALVSHIASNGSLSDQANGQALASFYTTLALQDLLSGNQTWKSAVTNNVQTWIGKNDIFGNGTAGAKRTNSNGIQWALTFYYAYKAYGDSSFLTLAQNTWDTTYTDFITADMVANAKTSIPPTRNITFNESTGCFDSRAVGGIFWLPDVPDNAQIQMDTVGPFATLAGYLYEATKNETYKTIGLLTMDFMGSTVMYNGTSNLNFPAIDIHACLLNRGNSPGFQGWYIQPLSIWANITSDSDFTKRLRQVVSTAAHTSLWTEADGVLLDTGANISDNPWDDKAIMVRALGEVLRRFPSSSDLATFVEAFITVQYSRLTTNARSGDNYGTVIFGPSPQAYNSNGNIIALDILNAAFDSLPHNASATSAPSSTSSGSAGDSKSNSSSPPIGAIVGGVMGGLAVLGALAGAAVWYRRKHRRAGPAHEPFDKDDGADGAAEPFMSYRPEPFTDEPSQPSHYDPWGNASGSTSAGPTSAGYSYPPLAAAGAAGAATMHPKLARMNAPPPPTRSISATAPSAPPSEVPSQSTQHDAGSTSPGQSQPENIPELVRGLVNNMLREHGAAPPEYDG
ncbi:hypothetical protein PENSPDRAFT_759722 [Peniophora sp. CONT]|nr:hypothetical protein PENSPDRAFT_759722 [Peniophora sp. CONT]